jgi:ubiquinone/menaquinone biosynthesis C-methylase UbiE
MSRLIINYLFVIGIPKPDNYFDYVHQRFMFGGIVKDKWKQHIQECARVCASDGWIEIIETTGQIVNGGPACQRFNNWLAEGVKTRNIDINMVPCLDELMREVGLINVTKQIIAIPFGPWGGRVGELFAEDFRLVNSSFQPLFTSVFNVSKEEVERNTALMMEEFKSHQAYFNICVYWCQKQ